MDSAKGKPEGLREACLREALAIIESSGIEHLSLREVARRLNVSHQAPYKHFPSRDHLLAEIVRRAFEQFGGYLASCANEDDPHANLRRMGEAYLRYAFEHPLQYRLMFGTPLPDPQEHPAMMSSARRTFDLLQNALTRRHEPSASTPDRVTADSLFIWACLHGWASILQTDALTTLGLSDTLLETVTGHFMMRLDAAMLQDN